MMRGSNVTRTPPRAGAWVRSPAGAATPLAPPVMAGHTRGRAIRRVRIRKTAPAGWRMPCSLPRGAPGVRAQGMLGIAEPYFALIARITCRAMMTCVAVLGCTPSHENAVPKGLAEHPLPNAGNGATGGGGGGVVGMAREESSVGLGLSHAPPGLAPTVESA